MKEKKFIFSSDTRNESNFSNPSKLRYKIAALLSIALIIGVGVIETNYLFKSNIPQQRKLLQDEDGVVHGKYSIHLAAEDYGCSVDKAILSLDQALDKVSSQDFIVKETRAVDNNSQKQTSNRKVLDVYLSDEEGNKVDSASKYITIEMNYGPNEGSPVAYSMSTGYNMWYSTYYLSFSLSGGAKLTSNSKEIKSINIEQDYTSKKSLADLFKKNKETYEGVEYNYAVYTPPKKSDKLFVWLNGAGEGGSKTLGEKTNVDITLLANRVTRLAEKHFQDVLGGCNILVPQAPTMWMDDGMGNIFAGNRKSSYRDSLVALIDDFVAKNNIKKVMIGGCSNGGYMTMNLAMDYGNKYQAYVPICEAMADQKISNNDIQRLKDLPIYFIYSKDDTTVNPSNYELPTIKRLKGANAVNLHVSTSEHVIDTSGKFKDSKGNPYQYMGHFSWIYFFNDEANCDECEKPVFEWLAESIEKN